MATAGEFAAGVLRAAGWEILFSGVLFSIVLGLSALLRNASPKLRHALWALVLLRLVLPLDLSTPFSLGRLADRARLAPALESAWLVGSPGSQGDERAALGGETAGAAATDSALDAAGWSLPLLALWAVGVLFVASALGRRRRTYRKVVGRAERVCDPAVLESLSSWKKELGVRRPVSLVTSDALRSPFTYGAVRPVIFLPRAVLASGDAGLVESVLAHELAHVRRWDDLVLKAELCVASLYFFNPIAWLSLRQRREESERICDELVLSSGRLSARTYAQSIVAVVKLGLTGEARLAPALVARRRTLRARLEKIMIQKTHRSGRARRLYPTPVAAALALLLLPMAGDSSGVVPVGGAVAPQDERPAQSVTLSNPMPGARISAAWGPMLNPFTREKADHRGIDLVGRRGAEIHAAAAGEVEEATTDYAGGASHGTVVILDHGGGIKTFYSHLDRLDVRKGQRVSRGDVLGTQGSTGKVTGAHLHFEVWENGEFRDPALFVTEWRDDRADQ
ncbi:MAG: M23/M56 family metallopeptidase [Gemmatimonadales bacterium]|jgi:murein DD-endopeptidase MepM/ murein hydrolase activator NlpD